VATMTALIVCRRFSASSKTIDAGDSKTSSVTSSAVIPNLASIVLGWCWRFFEFRLSWFEETIDYEDRTCVNSKLNCRAFFSR